MNSDEQYEVVVVGAGAAGIAVSIAAARAGSKVLLLEKEAQLGGTVTHALIHTIAGLYDSEGVALYDGLPVELAGRLAKDNAYTKQRKIGKTWVLNADPEHYQAIVEQWLAEEKNITVLCDSSIETIGSNENAIHSLSFRKDGQEILTRGLRHLVDTTGSAAMVRLAAPKKLVNPPRRAASGLILSLRSVEPGALGFAAGAAIQHGIKEAIKTGGLPDSCRHAWLDSGIYPDECYMKLFIPSHLPHPEEEGRKQSAQLLSYLKAEFPAFRNAVIAKTGSLGIRDGGQVQGKYVLTADDVRNGSKFPDAACKGCWPIEYWDCEKGLMLEYLAPGTCYEIPLRSLAVDGMDNLWVAGKCISADALARASARVAGTCWAMGEAVGKAAAKAA